MAPDDDTGLRAEAEAWLADDTWCDMVAKGNRLDLRIDGALRDILKGNRIPSDYSNVGEVRLDQGRYLLQPFGFNSMTSGFTQSYVMRITTDKPNVINVNALKCESSRAIAMAGPRLRQLSVQLPAPEPRLHEHRRRTRPEARAGASTRGSTRNRRRPTPFPSCCG